MMKITRELLDAGRNADSFFADEQAALIGLPLCRDWEERVLGREISEENAQAFVLLGHQQRTAVARSRYGRQRFERPELHNMILQARLDGRHGMSRDLVLEDVDPKWFSPGDQAKVYAAFDAGAAARREGTPCMCKNCRELPKILQNEEKRRLYRLRRYEELRAKGWSQDRAERQISEEIDAGMAL